MEKVSRNIITMVLAVIVLLAIAFALNSEQASAAHKPLEKGQYFKAGTCLIPGPGFGENGGYHLIEDSDTFTYSGEYYYPAPDNKRPTRKFEDGDEDLFHKNNHIAYAVKEKRYDFFPGGIETRYDIPGGYREYDSYVFYIIPGTYYNHPIRLYFDEEDKGPAWGIQVVSGTGTKEDPFRFGLLFSEPYSIDVLHKENGSVDVIPNAEAGNKVDMTVKANRGYDIYKVMLREDNGNTVTEKELQPDADGKCSFTMPEAEVTVDVTFKEKQGLVSITGVDGNVELYNSLGDALLHWENNTTLTLLEGESLDEPFEITGKRTLDLNGYVLKAEKNAFVIKSGGALTMKDSAPDRNTTYEGKNYTGGHLLGTVDGSGEGTSRAMAGVIDVRGGTFTMNGGQLINQSGSSWVWGISAAEGSKVRINNGYIKAGRAVIINSGKNVSIQLAGGRYDLGSWPVQQEGGEYKDAISLSGGYYADDMEYYPYIADGHKLERKTDQPDWKWGSYRWRVVDVRDPNEITIATGIENGDVEAEETVARPGEVVNLKANPAEHYRLKNYDVRDASGKSIKVTDGAFTMPDSAVTINAVFEAIPVSKLRLNKTRLTFYETGSETLRAVAIPYEALDKTVRWTSSNTSVATVDDNGLVTAVANGKTKITATAVGSGVSVSCNVTVQHQHNMTKTEAKEANCVTEGNIEYYTCDKGEYACGKIFRDEKGEKEISLSDTVIPVDGEKHGQINGFETYTETLSQRTCATPLSQNTITECKDCGEAVSISHHGEAALKHDWGEWEMTEAPTDTKAGEEKRVCKTDPSHVETRRIPATSHVHFLTKVDAKARTCEETGNIEYWICYEGDDPCGLYFADKDGNTEIGSEDIVTYPLGHTAGSEVRENETKATCEAAATYEAVVYCGRKGCNEELSREVKTEGSALGHNWGYWKTVDENTHKRVCLRDSSHVDIAPHMWDDGDVIPPTCHTQGKTVFTCAGCGYKVEKDFVEPDPDLHDFGKPKYTWNSDNSKVTAKRSCKHDGYTEKEVTRVKVTKSAPTCTKDGFTAYKAIFKNDAFYTEKKIPGKKAKGHKWDLGKVTKKATVDEAGAYTFTCKNCGATKEKAIPKARTAIKGKTVRLKATKLWILPRFIMRSAAICKKHTHGKVTYEKVSDTNKFSVSEKTGWIRTRGFLKKGTYELAVKVKCSGNTLYAPYEKVVTVTIKVW